MGRFRVTVDVEVDGDTDAMQEQLASYLAGGDGCNFFDDYGYAAWGGYEGPFAVSVRVADENGKTLAHHVQRGKPCDCCGDFPQPEGVATCKYCQEGDEDT
jgi:hypothetical protein